MPSPFSPWLAIVPFFLCGMTGVVSMNAQNQYFLRALPVRSQVPAAMISALVADALAGFIGMAIASGLMKFSEYLARGAESDFMQYRIYYMLAFVFSAVFCIYPVLRLKRFVEKKA